MMKFISYFLIWAAAFTMVGVSSQTVTANILTEGLALTQKQIDLLIFASMTAKEDGHQYPQYLQGIIMQESMAGGMSRYRVAGLSNNVGNRYFGISQIKLNAAKDVMEKYPDMWNYLDTKTDEELQARLILDDHFNIRVASKYVLILGMNEHPNLAMLAYNQGLSKAQQVTNPSEHGYVRAVKQWVKSLLLRKIKIKSISQW